tara:strand:+ start:996 stop:1244 length:249 start_codon:yes stop_codon:yes gene_type:complete
MAKCKFCGFESSELIWDKAYHEISGKWRLLHKGQGRPHECKKAEVKEPEKMVFCPQCNPTTRKKIPVSKLQNHIKKEHFGFY